MNLTLGLISPIDPTLSAIGFFSTVLCQQQRQFKQIILIADNLQLPPYMLPKTTELVILSTQEAMERNMHFDILVNLDFRPESQDTIDKLSYSKLSGIHHRPHFQIVGRWAQTLFSQLASKDFLPFTTLDLFNHAIMGRSTYELAINHHTERKNILWDIESGNENEVEILEDALSAIKNIFPQYNFYLKPEKNFNANECALYVGQDPLLALWVGVHQGKTLLLTREKNIPMNGLPGERCYFTDHSSLRGPADLVENVKRIILDQEVEAAVSHFTQEYLGGLCLFDNKEITSSSDLFYHYNYILFNYVNQLTDINLPIPGISSELQLHLRGLSTVIGKLEHLNLFAVKALNELLKKLEIGLDADQEINDALSKIQEIDHLSDKTLQAYPEMDLMRNYYRFSKAGAEGENIVDISKSLVLVYHEMNQCLHVYKELISATLKKYQVPDLSPHQTK